MESGMKKRMLSLILSLFFTISLFLIKPDSMVYALEEAFSILQGPSITVTMDEDSSPTPFALTLEANRSGTWSIKIPAGSTKGAAHGTVSVSATPVGMTQVINYTPQLNYNGQDSFVVQCVDPQGATAEIQVTVNIRPRNDTPANTALPTVSGSLYRGATLAASTGAWNDLKDTAVSGSSTITYTYQWQRANSVSGSTASGLLNIPNATNQQYTLGLNDQSKYIRVTVTATDTGVGEPATANNYAYSAWQLIAGNAAPVITEGTIETVEMDEDSLPNPLSLTLHATDREGDPITWSLKTGSGPANGTASVSQTPTGTSQVIQYHPQTNFHGSDSFIIQASDGQGGVSAITIQVLVRSVNDAPPFTKGPDQVVSEDGGIVTVANWATHLSTGPPNETTQTLAFSVSNNNPALFETAPGISPEGTLAFALKADAFGVATIKVTLKDTGGTANNGVDTSSEEGFTITVNPVNDAPTFIKGPDFTLDSKSGPQSIPQWATLLTSGSANESDQTLSFLLENDQPDLFSLPPSIDATGTLTFTPKDTASGQATIEVSLVDNGGKANGGQDTSPAQTFRITLTKSVPDDESKSIENPDQATQDPSNPEPNHQMPSDQNAVDQNPSSDDDRSDNGPYDDSYETSAPLFQLKETLRIFGIITDAVSGAAIPGVRVELYYADTETNRVESQISSPDGSYSIFLHPHTDYYLKATYVGSYQYISPTLSVAEQTLNWDFRMNPIPTTLCEELSYKGVETISGSCRIDTALQIARVTYPGKIKNVILATANAYPDALAGSVLAYKVQAPILLLGDAVSDQDKVLNYLREYLDPAGTVYILGGTGVIGASVETAIQQAGFAHVMRLGGANRYQTALLIAEELDLQPNTPVFITSGENYPDALSISSVAAIHQYPILLSSKENIPEEVKAKILHLDPGKVFIIGLEGTLSKNIETQISLILPQERHDIVRIGGVDRYQTSVAVADYFPLTGNEATISTGGHFADALAGSLHAAKHNAPLLLVNNTLAPEAGGYLAARKTTGIRIFGGEAAVPKSVHEELKRHIVAMDTAIMASGTDSR